jgi:hypothetical protein
MAVIVPTDIVKFNLTATCIAAVWCRRLGITGTVIKVNGSDLEINVGLYYNIFARQDQLELVARAEDAPIPDDQGV